MCSSDLFDNRDGIIWMNGEVRTLDLKRESLNDKVEMQTNWIKELESQSKGRIDDNQQKITTLFAESDTYVQENEAFENDLFDLTKDQEKLTGVSKKLRDLGNLKGKISQKVSTITKEHKFFTDNTVCPTCGQDIQEEFRINKIVEDTIAVGDFIKL